MIRVVHSLPGRTRFHLNSSLRPEMIEYFIRSLPCIHSATYTPETGNVLIYHEPLLSLNALKMSLRRLFVKIKEEKIRLFSWRKFVPVAVCGAMFLANWYIQRNPFSSAVKMIVHRAAGITGILASIGEIKGKPVIKQRI